MTATPAVQGGAPVVRGTRIPVRMVVELWRQRATPVELFRDYGLTVPQIRACLRYHDRPHRHPGQAPQARRRRIFPRRWTATRSLDYGAARLRSG
ncbi:MAG: DUF433 domain-containing protein [Rhodospirillales bacterium]|nr:MAG: DUF433 domain-containing protein [Rhodospirillales bacterium]